VAEVTRADVTDLAREQPDGGADWAQRQIHRWTRTLREYEAVPGYPSHALPGAGAVREKLGRRIPRQVQFGLVHGDLHLGNMLFTLAGSSVEAIVDWELATLGDTRLDLAHLVVTWPGTLDSWPAPRGWTCSDTTGVVERYAAESGDVVDDFTWFRALAAYRMAALLEGTFARSLRHLADPGVGQRLHAVAVELLDRASQN
jgi:aminoglycoside phosphotransferase (APT) family kinase protein